MSSEALYVRANLCKLYIRRPYAAGCVVEGEQRETTPSKNGRAEKEETSALLENV